ncbi:unnamed protein product, partial [Polarella glacialis]
MAGMICTSTVGRIGVKIFGCNRFHRSKSNEFFHDCDREEPQGMVCLYGMLSALFVHHLYLRQKIEESSDVSEADREVFQLSSNLARLMIINKNNCLDFYDSSSWPLTLAQLVATLRPNVGEAEASLHLDPLPPPRPWGPILPSAAALQALEVRGQSKLVAYITGTHAALAREPAEMLHYFVAPLLGLEIGAVMEVADDTHCGFLGCAVSSE